MGGGLAALLLPGCSRTDKNALEGKTHIITLSFDDGFEKSSIRTAELFEKYSLSACINVIAAGHLFPPLDEYQKGVKKGDFVLWNELKWRGHEIMPHGYKHAHLNQLPFEEAAGLINQCLDMFGEYLEGFEQKDSVFNFPYNSSTPELERYLDERVMAYRTGGNPINPLPHEVETRLTCTSHGPENIDAHLQQTIDSFLAGPPGWLIYNTHGIDAEGWGPVSSSFLDELLDKYSGMQTVALLPAGRALKIAGEGRRA